jgi:BlaI family transcriptional regulator, penicillinase repressor
MTQFGERELDVMTVLWRRGASTVAEVRDALDVRLAYTTVLTILRNLEAKGFVRHEQEGRAHRYAPLVAQHDATESALGRMIDKMFGGSPEQLLTHLVSGDALNEAELRRLHELLSRRLGEGGKP